MSAAQIAAVGALLSGLGSVISAFLGMRLASKRAASECQERVEAMAKAFDMGLRMEPRAPDA